MTSLLAAVDITAKSIASAEFWLDLWHTARTSILSAIGEIIIIIVLFMVARFALFKLVDRLIISVTALQTTEEQKSRIARIRTLQGLVKSITGYLLFFVVVLMSLRAINVDPLPLLTTASVAGFAVAFGAQKLVKDVISGFFIILENQYSVGDYVTIAGVTGIVEEIGMRMTRLRDDIGKLYIISNGDISMVTNHCRGAIISVLDVGIAPGVDTATTVTLLNEVGQEIAKDRSDVLSPFVFQGVIAMDAAKVTLRIEGKIDPRNQDDILMDLRARIRNRLLQEQINLA